MVGGDSGRSDDRFDPDEPVKRRRVPLRILVVVAAPFVVLGWAYLEINRPRRVRTSRAVEDYKDQLRGDDPAKHTVLLDFLRIHQTPMQDVGPDPWGTPYRSERVGGLFEVCTCHCAGPDRRFRTSDDLGATFVNGWQDLTLTFKGFPGNPQFRITQ